MTYLEAALTILTAAGQPLHYADITRRALDQNLIAPSGLTPEATMGSRLYTETKQEGAQFSRVGRGIFALARQQPSGIDAQILRINQETRDKLRDLLHTMPPDRFEALVMELLLRMGFDENTVQVTPYQGDGGIDVTGIYRAAGLTEVNAAVQVKRWKGNVRAPTVTQLRGSLQVHQQGIIITTSDYSKGACKEAAAANKTRIGLINGDELIELLIKHEVGVQEKTLRVVGLDDDWWGELLATADAMDNPLDEPPDESASHPTTSRSASKSLATHEPSSIASDDCHESGQQVTPTGVTTTGPTGHKPAGFTIFGQDYPVVSWKGLLTKLCAVLAARHPDDFAARATTIKGRKRHYFAPSPDMMINPAPIDGLDLYVETNLSAKDTIKLCHRLLEILGEDSQAFDLTFAQAEDNIVTA